jgi:hypothetical protein
VVGVDKSDVTIAAAQAKFPALGFVVADAFDLKAIRGLSATGTFDKIFIDIGGIAELHTVAALVGLYFKAFKKCRIIVKSVFLRQMLENSEIFAL